MLYVEERTYLLGVVEDLIKFRLLDCTGGLLAMRCGGDHLLASTAGDAFHRWHLSLEDFVVTDLDGTVIEKHERSAGPALLIALEVFKKFSECNALLHTHSEFSHAFAALDRSVPQASHIAQTLGEVTCIRVEDQRIKEEYRRNPYPVHVPEALPPRPDIAAVNHAIISQIEGTLGHRRHELVRHGLAFTAYRHGIFVIARNMDEAFNNLARIEASARTYIYGGIILDRERREAT